MKMKMKKRILIDGIFYHIFWRFRNDDPDIGQDFTVGYINNNGKDSFYLVADDSEKAYEFDFNDALNDIFEWLEERLINHYDFEESKAKEIASQIREIDWEDNAIDYLQEKGIDNLENIISFIYDAIDHIDDKIEWISFLRCKDFSEYDEMCESDLWKVGQRMDDRFIICLYALQKCGEKLALKGSE